MDLQQAKHMLQQGVCELIFTKKDGSQRVAQATLVSSFIAEEKQPKGSVTYTEQQLRFFDVEVSAWRSCLVENIMSLNVKGK